MKKTILLLTVITLAACNVNYDMVGMFYGQSDRSDVRFEQSMEYNKQHGMPAVQSSADDYVIVLGTDVHIDSTTYNLDKWISIAQTTPNCPFAFFLGDLINAQGHMRKASERFPNRMPATWTASMTGDSIPFYGTPGNHDLYWGQWTEYRDFWYTGAYTITVTTPNGYKDLYIVLDSSDGTLGTKQMQWLKNILEPETEGAQPVEYRHKVVFTHTHVFRQDASQGHTSNYTMEETYELTSTLQQLGIEKYISGHDHSRDMTHFKGVEYIIVDTMEDPQEKPAYAVLHVAEEMKIDFINLK